MAQDKCEYNCCPTTKNQNTRLEYVALELIDRPSNTETNSRQPLNYSCCVGAIKGLFASATFLNRGKMDLCFHVELLEKYQMNF